MAITIETLEEEKYRRGKAFLFLHSNLTLAAAATQSFVICVGDQPVALKEVSIEGNGEIMSWKAWAGAQKTDGTGTAINEIKRNSNVDTNSGIEIIVDPTVTQKGLEFFANPIDLVAQVAAGNRAYLNKNLISNLFALQANTCYLIEITNNDTGPVKFELSFDVFTE
ncbi:hypothetical protein BA3_0021 [Thalassomonas phage BA3]|uniref:hypothetical protein n=1 Tax=Thalassomonas phage BA3 TaxID=469660 RepID=UPI00015D959A|nr:hypothetical protein BA3_0021 [Thalassomonas phage BA3]ABV74306.1 hypothetical protein BA3_0021 [Thalassomonas phage BA3]